MTTKFHTFLICLYVADPATSLASTTVFHLRTTYLFSFGGKEINISDGIFSFFLSLSLNFFFKTTHCQFNQNTN